jgi:hypothetical protein
MRPIENWRCRFAFGNRYDEKHKYTGDGQSHRLCTGPPVYAQLGFDGLQILGDEVT